MSLCSERVDLYRDSLLLSVTHRETVCHLVGHQNQLGLGEGCPRELNPIPDSGPGGSGGVRSSSAQGGFLGRWAHLKISVYLRHLVGGSALSLIRQKQMHAKTHKSWCVIGSSSWICVVLIEDAGERAGTRPSASISWLEQYRLMSSESQFKAGLQPKSVLQEILSTITGHQLA